MPLPSLNLLRKNQDLDPIGSILSTLGLYSINSTILQYTSPDRVVSQPSDSMVRKERFHVRPTGYTHNTLRGKRSDYNMLKVKKEIIN